MFSKMLQEFDVSETGDIMKEIGFDGVDLTVRDKGHVLPENVVDDLPPAIETLRGKGLSIPHLSTGIVSADEPHTENIFRMAAECGVPALKLGYHRYTEFGTLQDVMVDTREKLEGLAALARKYKVSANLHTHSGGYMSALAPITYMLIKDFDRAEIGAYIDPGHMFVEGGFKGWQIGIDILSPWINLCAAKSMGWERDVADDGSVSWRRVMFPINEGLVIWHEVFACLKAIGYDGSVSLHSEYEGKSSFRSLSTPEIIEQTKQDIVYIRGVIDEVYGG